MRSILLLFAAAASLSAACSRGVESPPPAPPQADPIAVDLDKLRLVGPDDRVLVEARGRPYIRAGEYNAWLGTYPLSITKTDAQEAQAQALDQMVSFRLLLERAVEAGYESKSGGASSDAPAIVLRYVTDRIRNSTGVTEAQARRYHDEHRAELAALDAPEVAPEIRLAAWKGAVRGAELAAALEANRRDAKVEILLASSLPPERKAE